MPKKVKSVIIGDASVGKTAMLIRYHSGAFEGKYIPTTYDKYSHNVQIDGREIQLELLDTAGEENYDRVRRLAYPDTDVLLVCFSVLSFTSYENVRLRWFPELKKCCPHSKIILVGTKYDLRHNQEEIERIMKKNEKPLNYEDGVILAEKIGALKYVECSALTQVGLMDVFDTALRAVLYAPTPVKKARCSIL